MKKNHIYTLVGALLILSIAILSLRINQDQVAQISQSLGWLGPAFIFLAYVLSQVIAPISSIPASLVGIKLYGLGTNLFIYYFACLAGATINFWIARKLGKPFVKRLVGQKTFEKIEGLPVADERFLLVNSRLFGYFLFDVLSYAFGLTGVSFKKYFAYTAVLTIVPLTLSYFVFRKLDFHSTAGITIYVGSLAIIILVFSAVFYKIQHKRNK